MRLNKILFIISFWIALSSDLMAQDPKLPATNLGMVNMQDGNPPGAGIVFQQVTQVYNSGSSYGSSGKRVSADDFTTLLSMQQFIHITNTKFLGGNVGYTALLPVVKITNVSGDGTNSAPVNPNPLGDLIVGPMVQWFDRKIGNMKFAHRLEIDAVVPIGAYNRNYAINSGANFYTFSLHHAFTLFASERLSMSMRNHLHYNTREIEGKAKAGMFYHNNYSVEYALGKSFRIEVTGYYLQQLQQDSYDRDRYYYRNTYGIENTKEHIFAYGLGAGYLTQSGTFLELKAVKEAAAVNRTGGFRATLLVNFKLN